MGFALFASALAHFLIIFSSIESGDVHNNLESVGQFFCGLVGIGVVEQEIVGDSHTHGPLVAVQSLNDFLGEGCEPRHDRSLFVHGQMLTNLNDQQNQPKLQ